MNKNIFSACYEITTFKILVSVSPLRPNDATQIHIPTYQLETAFLQTSPWLIALLAQLSQFWQYWIHFQMSSLSCRIRKILKACTPTDTWRQQKQRILHRLTAQTYLCTDYLHVTEFLRSQLSFSYWRHFPPFMKHWRFITLFTRASL
jgi:hypothetical protein